MGIYPFEDYQHYSPNIHTPNDLIGPSVNSFEMSQQYCRMNIGCLAELANPVGSGPQVSCNPVENFEVEYPYFDDDYSTLRLSWTEPAEGSTGVLIGFEVYRDNALIAEISDYEYIDEISENVSVEYYVTAVYDDSCEAASETLIVQSVLDIPEINSLDENIVSYEVYDLLGHQVYAEKSIWNNVDEIRVNNLPSGVYMIRLFVQNGNVITKKIIIK